jgi:hypothetical protein
MACPWPSRQDRKFAAGQSKEPAVLLRAVIVSLCLKGAIVLTAYASISWIGARNGAQDWEIGAFWLALTWHSNFLWDIMCLTIPLDQAAD